MVFKNLNQLVKRNDRFFLRIKKLSLLRCSTLCCMIEWMCLLFFFLFVMYSLLIRAAFPFLFFYIFPVLSFLSKHSDKNKKSWKYSTAWCTNLYKYIYHHWFFFAVVIVLSFITYSFSESTKKNSNKKKGFSNRTYVPKWYEYHHHYLRAKKYTKTITVSYLLIYCNKKIMITSCLLYYYSCWNASIIMFIFFFKLKRFFYTWKKKIQYLSDQRIWDKQRCRMDEIYLLKDHVEIQHGS